MARFLACSTTPFNKSSIFLSLVSIGSIADVSAGCLVPYPLSYWYSLNFLNILPLSFTYLNHWTATILGYLEEF